MTNSNVSYLIPKSRLHISAADPIEVLDEELVNIPLLGWTAAGQPIELHSDYDSVQVPANMVKKETFALRVKGNSMINENIEDGDIVIIERKASAENGESVVVRVNDNQVTMKRLYIEKGQIRLQPANDEMEPIIITDEQIEIIGIVKGVLKVPK
ncbi:transcriptional repressor LexA [Thiomicrorhabdus indica]|uniref:transcriptional repressor LexA n=1 Tax=Thiomicrorhabdus indica TaxID=2267253 RepID=UPI002AA8D6B7|nr:transcriptional repressor LexA [Thiomicrorhabdus indica]